MTEEIKNSELSSEQRDTAASLKKLLGQAMADRYVDACRLSLGNFKLRVSAPLAAHAMREFESMLREILKVPMNAVCQSTDTDVERISKVENFLKLSGFGKNSIRSAIKQLEPQHTHKEQIRKIVSQLDLDVEGDIANDWIALCDVVSMAHNRSFMKSLEVDNDFRSNFFEPFHTVVRGITVQLQKKYAPLVQRVNEILAMQNITKAIKIYSKEIPGALSLQWHFFRNLKSSAWLPHLFKKNLFGQPMIPFQDDLDTPEYMSAWPAGDYLLRMAKESDAETRKHVIYALKRLSGTNHPDIQRMGIEILIALPPEEVGPHAELVVSWLTRDAKSLYTHRAVKLVTTQAQCGQKEAALK